MSMFEKKYTVKSHVKHDGHSYEPGFHVDPKHVEALQAQGLLEDAHGPDKAGKETVPGVPDAGRSADELASAKLEQHELEGKAKEVEVAGPGSNKVGAGMQSIPKSMAASANEKVTGESKAK